MVSQMQQRVGASSKEDEISQMGLIQMCKLVDRKDDLKRSYDHLVDIVGDLTKQVADIKCRFYSVEERLGGDLGLLDYDETPMEQLDALTAMTQLPIYIGRRRLQNRLTGSSCLY